MVQARRVLAATDLPVSGVGRRVGFPDAGYFARIFGEVHGMSPTQWRRAGTEPVGFPDPAQMRPRIGYCYEQQICASPRNRGGMHYEE
jgi:AraC-like DNA-binding protein